MSSTDRGTSSTTRRALVTGGAGFIGSHVVDAYLARGYDVTILDDLSTGSRANLHPKARFVEAGITSPEAAKLAGEGEFDVVSHLAAQIDVRKSVADPVFDATVNIIGTINLMEGLRAAGARTRVIFSSTGGALYGDFVTPPNVEDYAKDPEAPYGIAKLSAEYYLAYYARVHGMDTVALRYANVYGPRQNPHGEAGVVAIFCNRILDGRPLTMYGDGSQTRDYVFVKDVAAANVAAAEATLPPIGRLDARGFNIGTGVEKSVTDLAAALGRAAGATAVIEHAAARPGEMQRSAVRVDKASQILQWRPTVDFDGGIAETYRWFAEQRARTAGAVHA